MLLLYGTPVFEKDHISKRTQKIAKQSMLAIMQKSLTISLKEILLVTVLCCQAIDFVHASRHELDIKNGQFHSESSRPGIFHLPLHENPYDENHRQYKYQHLFPTNDENDQLEQIINSNRDLSTGPRDSGTHFTTIFIGNPAQPQVLAVSTDSDYTAFPCVDLREQITQERREGDISETFVYSESDTFRSVTCGNCYNSEKKCDDRKAACLVNAVYRDMSMWEAFEAVDMAYIGGAPSGLEEPLDGTNVAKEYGFPLMFGCQTDVRGWTMDGLADGVMGFSSKPTSIVNQMYQTKILKRPAFSLCFGQKDHAQDEKLRAGSLTLGGFNPKYHTSQMVFATNLKSNQSPYSVYVQNIFLRVGGGESVKPYMSGMKIVNVEMNDVSVNQEGVVIDSSTPYTLFSQQLSEPFQKAWKLATGEEFSYRKTRLTEEELKALPTIILQLTANSDPSKPQDPDSDPNLFLVGSLDPVHPEDVLIAFPASRWMEYNSNTGMYRPRISFENANGSVLGANVMQGHDITFDLLRDRIGFAETVTCVYDESTDDDPASGFPDGFSYTDDLFNGEADNDMGLPRDNWGLDDAFTNDDIYASNAETTEFIEDNGACDTMVCRVFVGTGYVFAAMGAWVLWKCVNVKARVSETFGTQNNIEELEGIDFPDYDPDDNIEEVDTGIDVQMHPLSQNQV